MDDALSYAEIAGYCVMGVMLAIFLVIAFLPKERMEHEDDE